MLHVECPHCSKSYEVADALAGKAAKCRECGARIPIPALLSEPATEARRSASPNLASAKSTPAAARSKPTSNPLDKTPPTKSAPEKLSAKSALTKTTPAKPKPPAKKPAEDDFFEDDFEDIEDYGDVDEFDDFEPTPSHRASSRKRKKKKSGAGSSGFAKGLVSLAVWVKSKMSPFLVALLLCFIAGAAGMLQPAIAASAMFACMVGGVLTIVIANLWMVIVTFRISPGWAIFFLFGGLIDMGLTAIGLGIVGALVSLFGFFVSIKLLIENWSEYRGPVHLALAGFMLIITGPIVTFFGMAGAAGVAQQGGVNPGFNAPGGLPKVADQQNQIPRQQSAVVPNAPAVENPFQATNPAVAQDDSTTKPNSAVQPAPVNPFPNLPPPPPLNVGLQPSGRVVTFRFQSFGGQGDAAAAARLALRNVAWADLNDLEVDAEKGEIRIGQLGGFVNTEPARQALVAAGFQLQGGISIGNKSSIASAAGAPKNVAANPPAALANPPAALANPPVALANPPVALEDVPEKSQPAGKATSKQKSAVTPPATNPPEKPPGRTTARRIVIFRYERFTGKGSTATAVREALKRIDWADQEDIVLDASKKEIRIGLLTESPNFEQARKTLTTQGFVLSVGVNTMTTKD